MRRKNTFFIYIAILVGLTDVTKDQIWPTGREIDTCALDLYLNPMFVDID